jgi:transposase
LFGTPVSEATVATMTRRAANGLTGFLDTVTDRLAHAEVVGFDETGLRVAGGLAWVHCARTDRYTLITCHPKRGRDGIAAAGVLPRLRGIAVHDAWAPYDTYLDAAHQLCCAHAVRELRAAAEAAPTRNGWHWATQGEDALTAIQKLVTDAATAAHPVDFEALGIQIHAFRCAALIGAAQTRGRSTPIMGKHHALARRLVTRHDDYLRFAHDTRVPADNNGAERDIRMIKLRQKVSGCLRTLTGAQQFCAIRSYLSTAAKHGRHFFDTLVRLAEGQPWLPAPQ